MATSSTTQKIVRDLNHWGRNEAGVISVHSQAPVPFQWEDTVDKGENIRDWRRIIARGGNATTMLSGRKRVCELQRGFGYAEKWHASDPHATYTAVGADGDRIILGSGTNAFPNFNLTMAATVANNQALVNYYRGINEIETRFKGLVFAGELREMLQMIKSPARSLRRGVGDYLRRIRRSGSRISVANRPRFVRDTWLEYSFGWVPTIRDLDSAITAFYTSDVVKPIFEMVKGTGRDIVERQAYQADEHVYAGMLYTRYKVLATEEVYVKYFGIHRSEGNGVANLHHYGFRPSEFVPTLWELIPYSFLVDYFTNIGEILESWSYRFISNGWTASTTRRVGVVKTYDESFYTPNLPVGWTTKVHGSPGRQVWRETSVLRTPTVTPGIPSLELQVPGSWSKWVNIVALSSARDRARYAIRS